MKQPTHDIDEPSLPAVWLILIVFPAVFWVLTATLIWWLIK